MAASAASEQECGGAREWARLLAPGGEDAAAQRGPRKALRVAAVALVAAAVLVMSATLAPKSLRRFASQSGVVLSEEKDATEEQLKEGYHYEQHCGTDYRLRNVLHNNLGGAGPDSGKEGIVYNASENKNGDFVRNLKVKVNALTDYASESSGKNGMSDDFGTIRVDAGKSVHLKFSFFSEDDKPLTLRVFRITLYDLDAAAGHKSNEYAIGYGEPKVDTTSDTQVKEKELKAGTKVMATEVGSGSDNPDKSTQLTESQKEKSAVMVYRDVHSVELTLGSTKGTAPRAFEFALHSALACKTVQVPDSGAATTSPATRLLVVVAGSLLFGLGRL